MTPKITTIYDSLMDSPILKNLSWSSLVDSIILLNVHLLRPDLTHWRKSGLAFLVFGIRMPMTRRPRHYSRDSLPCMFVVATTKNIATA